MCTRRVCPAHDAPFAYVAGAFFETLGDCIVWANRGGGKTELGAVVTHLDSLFKPGCETRILGGSLEQSDKMYQALRRKWQPQFADCLAGEPTKRRTELKNGSAVEILTQSLRSVRGQRVPKVKCDEVDEFKPEVWQAVQFVTQSQAGIKASFEAFSTMHRLYGLMQQAVAEAEAKGVRVLRWCLLEVLERCRERSCSRCELSEDCRGTAREGVGYFPIEDAIRIKRRSSAEAWRAEMLCQIPSREGLVYADFDEAQHVVDYDWQPGRRTLASFDFGFVNPFVCLFFQVDEDDRLCLFEEYYVKGKSTLEHARILAPKFRQYRVQTSFADPAGRDQRAILKEKGMVTKPARNDLEAGLEAVRQRLKLDLESGKPGLFISRRCTNTIREMSTYHYPQAGIAEHPEKVDDHALDALRYLALALKKKESAVRRVITSLPGRQHSWRGARA